MSLRDHQRLDKLYPALDGDQRIAALIDSVHRTGKPDALLLRDIPERQASQFWHRVGLLRAAHTQLGWYLTYVEALVGKVELRFSMLLVFFRWACEAEQVLWHLTWQTDASPDDEISREARLAVFAKLRRRVASVEFGEGEPDTAITLENMPRQLLALVISELAERWCEVRLANLAVEELQRQLGGNHPLHPDEQALLAGCRARLEHINTSLAELGFKFELPEPDDEDLERMLELLHREAMQ